MIESRVLVNMKVNDLFKEFDATKERFFNKKENKTIDDALLGEIWVTAAANALLCSLGMTIAKQEDRRAVLNSIADMLERAFPEQKQEKEAPKEPE